MQWKTWKRHCSAVDGEKWKLFYNIILTMYWIAWACPSRVRFCLVKFIVRTDVIFFVIWIYGEKVLHRKIRHLCKKIKKPSRNLAKVQKSEGRDQFRNSNHLMTRWIFMSKCEQKWIFTPNYWKTWNYEYNIIKLQRRCWICNMKASALKAV